MLQDTASSKIFISENFSNNIQGKVAYLDNDFLSELFFDKDLLQLFIELTTDHLALVIDPMIEFEFLRSAFIEASIRHDFIRQELFLPAINHQEIFKKIQSNALLLSNIYAQNGISKGVSVVDLLLAGRVMIDPLDRTYILTGNIKHFPSCLFDIEATITKRNNDESIKSYALIKFNLTKFRQCEKKLSKIK